MPVIGHISNGASSERAISYGFGKNRRMKNNTEQWLSDNGVNVDFPYIGYSSNSRAVSGLTPVVAASSQRSPKRSPCISRLYTAM